MNESHTSAPLLRAVLWSLLTRVLTLPLGLIQGALLARQLQPDGLGRYSALLTDVNLLVCTVSLGLPGALAILIGERPRRLRRLLRLAGLWGAAAVLLPGLLASLLSPHLGGTLRLPIEVRLIALATLCQYGRDVLSGLLWGTQQFRAQSWQGIVIAVAQLGAVAALAALRRLDPRTALLLQICSNVLLAGLCGLALRDLSRRADLWEPAGAPAEPLLLRALAIGGRGLLHGLPGLLLMRVDVYLIQHLLPGDAAQRELGIYQAGVRVGELLLMVPGTLNSVLFAKAAAREDVVGTTVACAKLSLYLGLLCLACMAAVGQPLLVLLYGERYAGSFVPCLLVLVGCCGFCLSTPLSGTLSGEGGYPRSLIVAEAVALLVNVAANLLLIPPLGVVGAAAASALSYLISAGVLSGAFLVRYGVGVKALLLPESPRGLWRRVVDKG